VRETSPSDEEFAGGVANQRIAAQVIVEAFNNAQRFTSEPIARQRSYLTAGRTRFVPTRLCCLAQAAQGCLRVTISKFHIS
jgi:hypothetical protein